MEKTYNLSEMAWVGALTSTYTGITKSPHYVRESLIEAAVSVGILLFEWDEKSNEVLERDISMTDWVAITKAGRGRVLDSD